VALVIRLCWELADEPYVGAESLSETGIEFGLKFGRTMGDLQRTIGGSCAINTATEGPSAAVAPPRDTNRIKRNFISARW
jgi:hypothetical protein